jgi:hypothetical protein
VGFALLNLHLMKGIRMIRKRRGSGRHEAIQPDRNYRGLLTEVTCAGAEANDRARQAGDTKVI